jgi:hypothetical protein
LRRGDIDIWFAVWFEQILAVVGKICPLEAVLVVLITDRAVFGVVVDHTLCCLVDCVCVCEGGEVGRQSSVCSEQVEMDYFFLCTSPAYYVRWHLKCCTEVLAFHPHDKQDQALRSH